MDLVDSSLLADMILQWHEPPSCTFTDGVDLHNVHSSYDINVHSNIVDSMLVDVLDLPEPFAATNSLAKPVSSISLWSGGSGRNEFVFDPRVAVSERMVRLPSVVQKGGCGFDVSLVKASDLDSPQYSASAPFTDPPEVKPTTRARKGAKATEPAKRRNSFDAEQVKENRAPTDAEHIIRERQRRDDMAAKYVILESLLPRAPKRERAVVVEDATLLVRELQQKKAQLVKRRDHLNLVEAPCNQHSNRITKKLRTLGCMRQQQQTSAVLTAVEIDSSKSKAPSSSSEGREELLSTEKATISAINVHTGNDDDIVVEIMWNRPRPSYQSSLIRAVEGLGLEVTRCSVIRVTTWLVQCFLTCSKSKQDIQLSETLIVGALKNVLTYSR